MLSRDRAVPSTVSVVKYHMSFIIRPSHLSVNIFDNGSSAMGFDWHMKLLIVSVFTVDGLACCLRQGFVFLPSFWHYSTPGRFQSVLNTLLGTQPFDSLNDGLACCLRQGLSGIFGCLRCYSQVAELVGICSCNFYKFWRTVWEGILWSRRGRLREETINTAV